MLVAPILLAGCGEKKTAASIPNSQSAAQVEASNRTGEGEPIVKLRALINPAVVLDRDPEWQAAESEVYAESAKLDELEKQLAGTSTERFLLRRGPGEERRIALTFDDGPHPNFTPVLLNILKDRGVKATFFVIGHMAEKYPELVKRMAAEGHEVANHTFSHVTLTKLPEEEVTIEYKAANDMIRKLAGKPARYCRPPGGDADPAVLRRAELLGMTTVLWTDDPGDYRNPGVVELLNRETKALTPGGIILLHDGSRDTLNTLVRFIETAKAMNYRFVSLEELANPAVSSDTSPTNTTPELPAPMPTTGGGTSE